MMNKATRSDVSLGTVAAVYDRRGSSPGGHRPPLQKAAKAIFVLASALVFITAGCNRSSKEGPAPKGAEPFVGIFNEKVNVTERVLAAGEALVTDEGKAAVIVYLDDGLITTVTKDHTLHDSEVKRGKTEFLPPGIIILKNRSKKTALRLVRTEYVGKGSSEVWGAAGLAPHYTVLFENPFGRVYEIRIAAGMQEAMHTHHERVVVGLSGAELEHVLPDGGRQTSSLKTGEIAWRPAATHIGHNIGKTDLWAIAIEPK